MPSSIDKIKNTGKFTWGQPVKWYEIGPYTLLEYHPKKTVGSMVCPSEYTDEISFHGWIDGEDANESWPSLETGLIGLVCKKYQGASGLEYFFCRGIQAPPYDKVGCACPQGSLCEFFNIEDEACRYGKI